METLRSDGNAVEVELVEALPKGSATYLDGFAGITMQAGSSGETVAMEIQQREHEINIDRLTGAKGDIIYMDAATRVVSNDSSDIPFMKVTSAKDANDYIWGILLPQS